MMRTVSRHVLSAILPALVVVGLAVMHTQTRVLEQSVSSHVASGSAMTPRADMAALESSSPSMPPSHDEHMSQACRLVLPPLLALSFVLLVLGLRRVLAGEAFPEAVDRWKRQRRPPPLSRGPDRMTLCVMRV